MPVNKLNRPPKNLPPKPGLSEPSGRTSVYPNLFAPPNKELFPVYFRNGPYVLLAMFALSL